jgi:hypothetical protein
LNALSYILVVAATDQDTYGSSLQASFQGLSANYGIQTTSIAFSSRATDEEIATAVTSLQTTQIRHFYAICYEEHYIPIMTAAVNQSIVGSGFLWIFPGFDLINIYNTLRFPPGTFHPWPFKVGNMCC